VGRLILVLAALGLAGCVPRVVKEYVPVEVVRTVYVEVDPELTNPHPIVEGPPSACPDVARQRAEQLRLCNIDKAAIRGIEGGPARSDIGSDR
jgi:hypothetical protein